MSNLTPAYTFILAVIFRMEKLALRSSSTQAKIMGTIVSISGAIVVVLFEGPTLMSTPPPSSSIPLHQPLGSSQSNWVIGSFLLASQHLLTSIWSIVQAVILIVSSASAVDISRDIAGVAKEVHIASRSVVDGVFGKQPGYDNMWPGYDNMWLHSIVKIVTHGNSWVAIIRSPLRELSDSDAGTCVTLKF